MADLKGAVKMTIDYSDGSQTIVNYNPMGEETKIEVEAVPVEEKVDVSESVEVVEVVEETKEVVEESKE